MSKLPFNDIQTTSLLVIGLHLIFDTAVRLVFANISCKVDDFNRSGLK